MREFLDIIFVTISNGTTTTTKYYYIIDFFYFITVLLLLSSTSITATQVPIHSTMLEVVERVSTLVVFDEFMLYSHR